MYTSIPALACWLTGLGVGLACYTVRFDSSPDSQSTCAHVHVGLLYGDFEQSKKMLFIRFELT